MIRQARTYFVGAFSGVTLIAIAIGVFVILVSAQVFHDWPITALSSHSGDSAVAPAKPVSGGAQTAAAGATTTPTTTTAAAANPTPAPKAAVHHKHAASGEATGPATAVETAPEAGAVGDESSTGGGSGSNSSLKSPSPAPGSEAGSTSSGGSGSSTPTTATGSSGGGSGSGGGGSSGTGPVETVTGSTKQPSETLTETVNGTVSTVEQTALGGTLEKTGVTEVTENVVNGVAGPESVVGKTVDGTNETAKGLLGGGEH